MIKERIIQYLEYKQISKYKFYKDLQISNGFLDKEGSIGSDKCEIIFSHYSDINPDWLITGKGPMLRSEVVNDVALAVPTSAGQGVPLVGINAMAGYGSVYFNIQQSDIQSSYVIPEFQQKKVDFMLRVEGSSMYPKYSSGDIIAIRTLKDTSIIQWNKTHLIATEEFGIMVKRPKPSKKGEQYISLVSDNPEYDPFDMPIEKITGIGIIVGVIRME